MSQNNSNMLGKRLIVYKLNDLRLIIKLYYFLDRLDLGVQINSNKEWMNLATDLARCLYMVKYRHESSTST